MAEPEDFDRERAREDAEAAFADKASQRSTMMRDGVIGGVHMVRDIPSDAVRSAGEVGYVAIDTARGLLVGVADGLRDIFGHVVPEAMRRGEKAGEERQERH